MDEDIKKALGRPWVAVSSILGFFIVVYSITNFFNFVWAKVIAVLSILVIIAAGTVLTLFNLVKKLKTNIIDLKNNNKGLIEAKNKYLEENVFLKEQNVILRNDNYYLRSQNEKLKHYFICNLANMPNDVGAESKNIVDFIIGGEENGKKYLENNKDNR